jgi:hypothetical protein
MKGQVLCNTSVSHFFKKIWTQTRIQICEKFDLSILKFNQFNTETMF